MGVNPFDAELAALQEQQDQATAKAADWTDQLRWHKDFRPEEVHEALVALQHKITADERALELTRAEVARARDRISALAAQIPSGWNPTNWFSKERAEAKQQHGEAVAKVAAMEKRAVAQLKTLGENKSSAHAKEVMLRHFHSFDSLLAQASVRGLELEISAGAEDIGRLRRRKETLDTRLRPLLAKVSLLKEKQALSMLDYRRASELEHELRRHGGNDPRDRFERRRIHDTCEQEFGTGKPHEVMRASQQKCAPVERDLEKLHVRIADIVRNAQLDVRTVVIDGNNLCYEQRRFVGLVALQALVPVLAERYTVKLVFDAGIRRMLQMHDDEIRRRFLTAASVHVVGGGGAKADEVALDAASGDEHAFVLSNDRFADFVEKEAVACRRLLKYELAHGAVAVPALDLRVPLEARMA